MSGSARHGLGDAGQDGVDGGTFTVVLPGAVADDAVVPDEPQQLSGITRRRPTTTSPSPVSTRRRAAPRRHRRAT